MANQKLVPLTVLPGSTSSSVAHQRLTVTSIKSEPQVMIKREPHVSAVNSVSSTSSTPTASVEEWNIRVPRSMAKRFSVLKLPSMGNEWNTPRQVHIQLLNFLSAQNFF